MLLKQLKYFISIVEKGNFTEAAEKITYHNLQYHSKYKV